MGKCRVVQNIGEGLYIIVLQRDRARIDAQLEQLKKDIDTWTNEKIPEAEESRDEALEDLESENETLPDLFDLSPREILAIETERLKFLLAVDKANAEVTVLTNQLESFKAEVRRLEKDAADPPPMAAWCVDYTLDLAPDFDYGSIEINGERFGVPVQVRFGYNGQAIYNGLRDGKLQHVANSTPEAVFVNLAFKPSWQKFRPGFRLAEIADIHRESDTCSIILDDAKSSQLGIDINPRAAGYDDMVPPVVWHEVPIVYMQCHSAVFNVGDRVVVEFSDRRDENGKWIPPRQPNVVGFENEPRPCSAFLGVPFDAVNVNGLGETPPDTAFFSGAGANWSATVLDEAQFGNVDWQGSGVTMSWWGPPNRYSWETIERYDDYFAVFNRPWHIWKSLHDARLRLPSGDHESIFQQTKIYRELQVFATAPHHVLGAALTTGPDGQVWLLTTCGQMLNKSRGAPDWDFVNDDDQWTDDRSVYVKHVIFYAAKIEDVSAWQEIGRLTFDDSGDNNGFASRAINSTSSAFGSRYIDFFRLKNANPWHFSASGQKSASLVTLVDVFNGISSIDYLHFPQHKAEMVITWAETAEDSGEFNPVATVTVDDQPACFYDYTYNAQFTLSDGHTNVFDVPVDYVSTINKVSYASGLATLDYDFLYRQVIGYDYQGEALMALYAEQSASDDASSTAEIDNMVETIPAPGHPTFGHYRYWKSSTETARLNLQESIIYRYHWYYASVDDGGVSVNVTITDQTGYFINERTQEINTTSSPILGSRRKSLLQPRPQLIWADLRSGQILFRQKLYFDAARSIHQDTIFYSDVGNIVASYDASYSDISNPVPAAPFPVPESIETAQTFAHVFQPAPTGFSLGGTNEGFVIGDPEGSGGYYNIYATNIGVGASIPHGINTSSGLGMASSVNVAERDPYQQMHFVTKGLFQDDHFGAASKSNETFFSIYIHNDGGNIKRAIRLGDGVDATTLVPGLLQEYDHDEDEDTPALPAYPFFSLVGAR